MSSQDVYNAVKKATVAIVASLPDRFPQRPFTIYGSGFCIHPEGVIVTCAHVFNAFVDEASHQRVKESGDRQVVPVNSIVPHAVFFGGVHGTEIHMHPVPIANAVTVKDFDLAALKLHKHPVFAQGYPTLQVADYSELHEMMEVATCGFPLGEILHDQIGTVTSSFTKGMISSIIPAAGVPREHLRGFQLDLTATNGNSGGPVFSPATGQVLGILQGGVVHHQTGHVVQGLTKAEPIYRLFDDNLINRILQAPRLPT
jgi:S1-C subfamily serine protease